MPEKGKCPDENEIEIRDSILDNLDIAIYSICRIMVKNLTSSLINTII